MLSHWTYGEVAADADLCQGDIIEPTPALRAVLGEAHKHFLDPKYIAFLVLTQSCDLVRREGYRGHHINLCVVRELSAVAERLIESVCGTELPRVFRSDAKLESKKLLARIINQNEQGIGLFYLHPDADAGITTPSVAMLRITIALRAIHYDTLLAARRGRLREEFQAKLGWLIGNLYARVGTADWNDQEGGKKQQDKIVKDVLDGLTEVAWASPEAIRRAKLDGTVVEGKSGTELREVMQVFEPPSLDKALLEEIDRVLSAEDLGVSAEIRKKFISRLGNEARTAELLRRIRQK